MKKRKIILLYWIIAIAFLPQVAYAYIDPATTTYIIQIITAIIITLGVTLSLLLYRVRASITNARMTFYSIKTRIAGRGKYSKEEDSESLHKDCDDSGISSESVKDAFSAIVRSGDLARLKASMPEFLRVTQVVKNETLESERLPQASFAGDSKWRALWREDRSYGKRLAIAAVVFASIAFTFIVFGSIDLVTTNAGMLPFRFVNIERQIYFIALICFAIPAVIVPIFRGRVFDFLIIIALSLLVAGYLQGNFLNTGLGSMTGDVVKWYELTETTMINLFVWGLIFFIIFAIRYFSKKIWQGATFIVPAAIIAIQAITIISLVQSGLLNSPVEDRTKELQGMLTNKGMFEVSADNNVFVIILDRLDDEYVDILAENDPKFFEPMDGFTHFDNYVSSYATTFAAVPEFLTGADCYWDRDQHTWFNEAWSEGTFLPDIKERDFAVKLYMEKGQAYDDIQQLRGIADNTSIGEIQLNENLAAQKILLLSAYRYAPFVLKPTFWMPADDFGRLVYSEDIVNSPYKIDDVYFYELLKLDGMQIKEEKGNFAFYHLQGPHNPFVYNENVQRDADAAFLGQLKGGFNIVYEMIDQLKLLGIYENSTIIVMGDHGWPNNPGQLTVDAPTLAGLFVKPAGAQGTPLIESSVPIGSANIRATIVEAAGGDPSKYGVPCVDVSPDDMTPRKYFWKNGSEVPMGPQLLIYDVVGDGREIQNWHHVDTINYLPYEYY